MPGTNTNLDKFSRFVSIAVLSCLLITGGLWVYHNRAEIVDGAGTSNKEPGNWFTRWAGVDATKLKDHGAGFDFGEQGTPFKTELQFDPDWFQKMHQPVEFGWDR
jgi:hypothetical protein